jgi:hypothetical protein
VARAVVVRGFRPKKTGSDQRVPVIARAICDKGTVLCLLPQEAILAH